MLVIIIEVVDLLTFFMSTYKFHGSDAQDFIAPPGGGYCQICAIRRRGDQGILFGLRIRDRVSFFEPGSKTGCQNLYDHSEPGCLFTVLFGILLLLLTYLSFVQEINPSFDVFNIFIVII